ncbi:hypothetical protein DFO67_11583 [Modicisalibacter xianhensis]|uniref:Uncharacterized protein n=1 Tax=Modicisalibacter xianhensis TaxID=442341 RepID=A0A4R8FRT5_9GAMM|nr:hypothetical protein [Halomonas xianhensis]TDX26818.1 hypothetical protein DFO67_11583 [Halomonas xianhensis]
MTGNVPSLCDELIVMLAEAGSRASAEDAARVIAGTLGALAKEHPGFADVAGDWNHLLPVQKTPPSSCLFVRRLETSS